MHFKRSFFLPKDYYQGSSCSVIPFRNPLKTIYIYILHLHRDTRNFEPEIFWHGSTLLFLLRSWLTEKTTTITVWMSRKIVVRPWSRFYRHFFKKFYGKYSHNTRRLCRTKRNRRSWRLCSAGRNKFKVVMTSSASREATKELLLLKTRRGKVFGVVEENLNNCSSRAWSFLPLAFISSGSLLVYACRMYK